MKYKCGHESKGVLTLDSDVFSLTAYMEWAYSVGIFGEREKCWECYCKYCENLEVVA